MVAYFILHQKMAISRIIVGKAKKLNVKSVIAKLFKSFGHIICCAVNFVVKRKYGLHLPIILIHFDCIGVAPPRLFKPQSKGSNSNAGKMNQI